MTSGIFKPTMTDSTVAGKRDSSHSGLWKWLLITLCILGLIGQVAWAISVFGLGGRPWFGMWGAYLAPTAQPYVARFEQPQPGLAAERAGIKAGDEIDLREQNLNTRIALFAQPLALQPILLVVRRGIRTLSSTVIPSTIWEGAARSDLPTIVSGLVWKLWFIGCAFLIAVRRASLLEARLLALVLLCWATARFVVPNAAATAFLWTTPIILAGPIAGFLLILLSSRFGTRSAWRRIFEVFTYIVIALVLIKVVAFLYGLVTLQVDPIKYGFGGLYSPSRFFSALFPALMAGVATVAAAAVATTARTERPRAAWLLLPLPTVSLVFSVSPVFDNVLHSWLAHNALGLLLNLLYIGCALAVTYALLKRRVLDFEFVLSRTLVVAMVSLIVVAAFVLLEWLLGTSLAGASRVSGVVANASLALILGLSLRYIHKKVDEVVNAVIFRKRHDDERALRDFSKEAAFVTEPAALLDQAIGMIASHTDARNAALLLESSGAYVAARSFGDGIPKEVNQNDPAILAMKSWHKPLDPHHYQTALRGAIALPMLARGRLGGVLVLGERSGGEAYAPDEVEVLAQFAHGVGSAFDAMPNGRDSLAELREAIVGAIGSMQVAIIDELRTQRRPAVLPFEQ